MENKEDIKKIVIAVPASSASGMNVLTAQCIGASIIEAGGLVIDFIVRRSCDIVSNRTWLVNEAIRVGGTHILFVDCDMLFPPDCIKRMLSHEKDIVGVEYPRRAFPLQDTFEALDKRNETEIYKAKFAGMGLMLINLAIFKDPKLGIGVDGKRSPWFSFGRDSEGSLAMGEDVWFAYVARDAGYDIWLIPTLQLRIYHLGEYGYTLPK